MECAVLNGAAIHFADEGTRDSPTLVFANSLGTDYRIWDGVVAELAGRFRTLRYDKRGHGLSDLGTPPYSIAQHAADLAALMDARAIASAFVCGLSIGGQIALALAETRPDLCKRLILSDTAPRIGDTAMWNARIALVEAGGVPAIAETMMERWFPPDYRRNEITVTLWRNMMVRTPAAGYIGSCVALRDSDLTAAAKRLRLPVLCIGGTLDKATPPELVQAMAAMIPGARFVGLEGAGHLPCIEQPALIARLIRDFCDVAGPAVRD